MELLPGFEKNWQSKKFPTKDKTILVAVSGGKDSMVLAHLLYQSGFSIAVAHCNFQLRAEASNLDEQLVQNWAKSIDITYHSIRFDTEKEMALQKKGVQETARQLRYNWFKQLKHQHQYSAIATAHHANDNAETLLINLCKGTGIAGMHGIPPKNGDIIRPLLFASRAIIDEYAIQHQIPYREDASNASTKYTRNAIRHNILPALDSIFPNVIERLNETIHRLSQVEIIYQQAIAQEKNKLVENRGADIYVPILKLMKRPVYETLCYEIFSSYGFSSAQIPEIIKLLNSESGHFVTSATHKVIRDRAFLIVTENINENKDLILIEHLPQTIETTEGRFMLSIQGNEKTIEESANTAFLDFDKVTMPLVLRRKRTGDYFYPLGMGMKKKKISRFLIDQKIALHLKEKIWIVENKMKIIWVAGMRLDERFKITNKTQKILRIVFLPK